MDVNELIKTLESQGKNTLANVIAKSGNLTIDQYSKYLWDYDTQIPLEPALIQAFQMEFKRLGIDEIKGSEIIDSFEKYRTLQTAPHTGLLDSTSVPAMALHTVALESIPFDSYYVVGTFSGIPFGNDSYPGALSFNINNDFENIIDKESVYYNSFKKRQIDRIRDVENERYNRMALYENTMRDDLVYRSVIPPLFKSVYPYLNNKVKDYLKYQDGDTDFTKVMLNSVQSFSQKLFNNEKIIFVDINEVITNYLTIVLKDTDHFIYKMFFNEDTHKKVMEIWSHNAHFFYDIVKTDSGKKQVHAYIESLLLKNIHNQQEINPEKLIQKLKNDRFCPGVFLGFTVLSFLNGFQCFGSFKQVSYLTDYKKTWLESNLLPTDITNVRTDSLTTGALPNENDQYKTAIDIILGASWQSPDGNTKFNDMLFPIQDRLIKFKV